MAGIYLHIPFCKQACYYCDFHFSTNLNLKQKIVQAIGKELQLQKDYIGGSSIQSIYFGGGTPSLLDAGELDFILNTIGRYFPVDKKAEITLEANPDDLKKEKLQELKATGINRLSIGVQSFNDAHLKYLNRTHNASEAYTCILKSREAGFDNISIDLIYAIPAPDHMIWKDDLAKIAALQPEHISSYCLTIEQNTVFGQWLKKGKIKAVEDEFAAQQFEILLEKLKKSGYEQYEISNFCLPGHHSRHNSNYWKQEKYLGIGPSAHSFNGANRQYNVANNTKYLKEISSNVVPFELDNLQWKDHLNEYIMTSLRTSWGCDLRKIKNEFAVDLIAMNKNYLDNLLQKDLLIVEKEHMILTDKGKLLADQIASDLFLT